jgi:hypothetical protein
LKHDTKSMHRRDFLLATGLASAAAVGAVATAGTTPKVSAAEPPPVKSGGYRASAHVLAYYKTTEA